MDTDRFEESLDELELLCQEETLTNVKFLILLTKQDNSVTLRIPIETVIQALDRRRKKLKYECLLPISAITGDGIDDMLEYFYQLASTTMTTTMTDPTAPSAITAAATTTTTTTTPTDHNKKTAEDQLLEEKFEDWLTRIDDPADQFLTKLRNYTLDSWDHYTHLRIAFLLLQKHGRKDGMELIFSGIRNFIENSSITQRSRGTTFHETMTYFWIHMVHFAIEAAKFGKRSNNNNNKNNNATTTSSSDDDKDHDEDGDGGTNDPNFKEFLLRNPQLANGGLFLHYYSKELMLKTADSRLQVMLPDKRPLPSILSDIQQQSHTTATATTTATGGTKMKISTPMTDSKFLTLVLQKKSPSMGHEARIRTIWTCLEQNKDNNIREGRSQAFKALRILDGEIGYHETQSYFWIQMVTLTRAKIVAAAAADANNNTNQASYVTYHDFIRDARAQFLRNPDYKEKYYSDKVWKEGVTTMVLPDKKQLPNVL